MTVDSKKDKLACVNKTSYEYEEPLCLFFCAFPLMLYIFVVLCGPVSPVTVEQLSFVLLVKEPLFHW